MLVDGERFASNRGLINLEKGVLGYNATISWNNCTLEEVSNVRIESSLA